MKMIIAGGRDYAFKYKDFTTLNHLLDGLSKEGSQVDEVVTGGAKGADAGGVAWAERNGIRVRQFPPDWKGLGRAAGPIRNRAMAEYVGRDGLCVLFPGGRGTASMKSEALRAGMKVMEVTL